MKTIGYDKIQPYRLQRLINSSYESKKLHWPKTFTWKSDCSFFQNHYLWFWSISIFKLLKKMTGTS